MASGLQIGERVYVPRSRFDLPQEASAFYRTAVRGTADRSVMVDLPNGNTGTIGTAVVRRKIGVMIINIGDLSTEPTLLDPLAKSVLQYFRLLLSDDEVTGIRMRSVAELRTVWQQQHGAYSHLVIVGHGETDGIIFGVDGLVGHDQFAAAFENTGPVNLISLCCKTGYAAFAQPLSKLPVFDCVIAPFHSVHGAVASQFCQTFSAYQLLEGETLAVAFRHARKSVPGGASFRLWRNGVMTAGPK